MGYGNLLTFRHLILPLHYPSCIILTTLRSLSLGEIVMHGSGRLRHYFIVQYVRDTEEISKAIEVTWWHAK
jgi:hypothetical protein